MKGLLRRPNVRRLRRTHDVAALARALEYREVVSDGEGRHVDRGAHVRGEVVEVLAECQDPRAVTALVRGLRDDTSYVRLKAIEAVRGRRDHRILEALAEGVAALPAVAGAAEARGHLRSLDPARGKALDALLELGDTRVPERIAAHMLYRAGDQPVTDTDEWAFRAAVAAVPDGGGPQLAASIATLLGHERPEVRSRAQAMLRWIGPASVEPLIAALRQPHLRGLAIAPLGELGDARAMGPLLDMLSDHEPAVRSAAARALGQIRHPGCVHGLMLAAHDHDQGVRTQAIEALDKLGTAAVVMAMHDVFEPLLVQLQAITRQMRSGGRAREASTPQEPPRPGLGAAETQIRPLPRSDEREEREGSPEREPPLAAGRRTTVWEGASPSPNGERRRPGGVRSRLRRSFLNVIYNGGIPASDVPGHEIEPPTARSALGGQAPRRAPG
jgi:HEAT repeat protein